MYNIILAILVVAGMGLLIGLILAVVSIILAVPTNKKAQLVLECLPGANCGACGYTGCEGYAKALADGKAKNGLCIPGGETSSAKIAELLGVESESKEKMIAVVHCVGNCENTTKKALYQGIKSCASLAQLSGTGACNYGCLGCGDCVKACSFDAIKICKGVAVVDSTKCSGCASCTFKCPKKLISLIPAKNCAVVRCSNHDKGALTRKACSVGCIGCKKCAKVCESGAITVKNFCASVDYTKCTGCQLCTNECFLLRSDFSLLLGRKCLLYRQNLSDNCVEL